MLDTQDPLAMQRATVSPYRHAANLLFHRLLWDINPKAWQSRRRLAALRDVHEGKKAVILCNGPSLNKVPFESLDGVYTFGLNKISLLFDRTSFRPSCIVAINHLVMEQSQDFYNSTDIPLFLGSSSAAFIRSRPSVTFVHAAGVHKFARDCSISLYSGHTVTFVALQLAFHMGFQEVCLVGCDHNFAVKGPANKTVVSGEKDESHFDPNYFAGGVKWQLPDLAHSEMAYKMADDMYNVFGRKIYNCTEGGKLEIFQRLPLSQFLTGT